MARVLVCTDNFKGTATAEQVGATVKETLGKVDSSVHVDVCPLTDGGAGFLNAMCAAVPTLQRVTVTDVIVGPLGEKLDQASYGVDRVNGYAVVEMAEAAGIERLAPNELNPFRTTSYGVGQLLKMAAGEPGVTEVLVGIGGSATNDGAIGMLQALGATIKLVSGRSLGIGSANVGPSMPPLPGQSLVDVTDVIAPGTDGSHVPSLRNWFPEAPELERIVCVCDVQNPLVGPEGASMVYGPQKGGTPLQLAKLDRAMGRFAKVMERRFGVDVSAVPGAGGAGGMCGTLHAALGASVERGAVAFADKVGLSKRIADATVVITGEGSYDTQTTKYGKTVSVVEALAKKHDKRVVILCGVCKTDRNALDARTSVIALTDKFPAKVAMSNTRECIADLIADRRKEILEGAAATRSKL